MLEIEIDWTALNAKVEAFAGEIERGLYDVVQQTCLDAAEHARTVGRFVDRTGRLRASIRARGVKRTARGAEGSFGTDVPYAWPVEAGQRPHVIAARRAAFLRWETPEGVRLARVVRHPGTHERPFMGPAAIKAAAVLFARTELLVQRAIEKADR